MSWLAIVPNELRDAINKKIDEKTIGLNVPESDRQLMYEQLLAHYDATGIIADFDVKPVHDAEKIMEEV